MGIDTYWVFLTGPESECRQGEQEHSRHYLWYNCTDLAGLWIQHHSSPGPGYRWNHRCHPVQIQQVLTLHSLLTGD